MQLANWHKLQCGTQFCLIASASIGNLTLDKTLSERRELNSAIMSQMNLAVRLTILMSSDIFQILNLDINFITNHRVLAGVSHA